MPTIVNPTAIIRNFGGTQVTANYNNSGSDLIVTIGITATSGNPNFSSLLYNGVAMSQVINNSRGSLGFRDATFYLVNAAQGTNTLTINLNNVSGNPCQIVVAGVNNSSGIPTNTASNGLNSSPHSRNLTVLQNSVIWGYSSAFQPLTNLSIDGSNQTIYGNSNVNRFLGVAYKSVNSGLRNFTASSSNLLTNARLEILDSGGTGGGRRYINIT